MCRLAPAIFLFVGFSLTPGDRLFSDEPEHTTAKVLEAWTKRRAAVRTMDYVATGNCRVAKGAYTEDAAEMSDTPIVGEFPPEERVFPVSVRFATRLSDRKLRLERRDDVLQQMRRGPPIFSTDYRWTLIDGASGFKYLPDEHHDASTGRPQSEWLSAVSLQHAIDPRDHPVLLAHGIVQVVDRNFTLDDLATTPEEIPYTLVDRTLDKKTGMLVLRSKPFGSGGERIDEAWVDPARGYVITKHVMTTIEGRVWFSIDLKYEADGDDWALSEWACSNWGRRGADRTYTMKVNSRKINADLPDGLFLPPAKTKHEGGTE